MDEGGLLDASLRVLIGDVVGGVEVVAEAVALLEPLAEEVPEAVAEAVYVVRPANSCARPPDCVADGTAEGDAEGLGARVPEAVVGDTHTVMAPTLSHMYRSFTPTRT